MKATINNLWDTGTEIIAYDDNEFDRPTSIADLRKCSNVLVGNRGHYGEYEVLIGNSLYFVVARKFQHPSCGGSVCVLEAEYFSS